MGVFFGVFFGMLAAQFVQWVIVATAKTWQEKKSNQPQAGK